MGFWVYFKDDSDNEQASGAFNFVLWFLGIMVVAPLLLGFYGIADTWESKSGLVSLFFRFYYYSVNVPVSALVKAPSYFLEAITPFSKINVLLMILCYLVEIFILIKIVKAVKGVGWLWKLTLAYYIVIPIASVVLLFVIGWFVS